MIIIECKQAAWGYRSPLISPLDLQLKKGECLAVTGPSGVGKTTFLQALSGIGLGESPLVIYSGQIKRSTNRFGFVFQNLDQLYPWKTLLDNVLLSYFSQSKTGLSKKSAQNKAFELLNEVGLNGWQSAYPKDLSGGMKQRVAFCRALFSNPDIVFLDEPFASIDFETTKKLIDLLKKLQQKYGFSIVIVTHQNQLVKTMAQRRLILTGTGDYSLT